MYFAYFRPPAAGARLPIAPEPACTELPDDARRWSRRRAKAAGLACGRCGLDFRRDAVERDPATMPFEVAGPNGAPRFECGGCHPEFIDSLIAAMRRASGRVPPAGAGARGAGAPARVAR
ncbi:hypothetical protein ACFOVU_11565 [Nocardiopsis sediminis]|uniref:Uncharacterized protein n=1 Tax=Nocardiopsis sediminis TaxID=1778267 RepID=A0ABV8FPK9_9ACTN